MPRLGLPGTEEDDTVTENRRLYKKKGLLLKTFDYTFYSFLLLVQRVRQI